MPFARLIAGTWEEVTGPFTVGAGEDAIAYPADWLEGADAAQRAEARAAEIVEDDDVAPCLQLLGKVLVDVDGVPHRSWAVPPAADVRSARRAELAALRWEKQQTMKWRGRVVAADDVTTGRIVAAVVRGQVTGDQAATIRWKFGDADFDQITLVDLVAYGGAIGAHLQGCYDREAELVAAIAAAPDVAAICAIDITGGWPA